MPWWLTKDGYATRKFYLPSTRLSKWRKISRLSHRVVLERILGRPPRKDEITDHIDGNKLDNRRENLRVTDMWGNCQNRHNCPDRNITPRGKRWIAQIFYRYKRIHLGVYDTRAEAAAAALAARKALSYLDNSKAIDIEDIMGLPASVEIRINAKTGSC